MIVQKSRLVPPGKLILCRNGMPVWAGSIGAPIEDVECDKMIVSPSDYDRVRDGDLKSGDKT